MGRISRKQTEIADLLRKHGGKSGTEDSIDLAALKGNIETHTNNNNRQPALDVNAKGVDGPPKDSFGILLPKHGNIEIAVKQHLSLRARM